MKEASGIKLILMSCVALCLSVIICPLSATAESPEDLLIIANSATAVGSISKAEARELFLKTKSNFGGRKTIPIHAATGSLLRRVFAQKVLGMTPEEEKQYWEKQKIMAGTTPPTAFPNTARAVFKLKSSISYVFRKDYKNVGKILLVIPG